METLTRLDLFALGTQYVLSKAKAIDPAKVLIDGSNSNCFVGSTSVMGDAVMRQLLYQINRTFLDGCQGEDLDRWGWDRYQQTRKGASVALGQLRVYRASVTAGAGSVPIGTALKTRGGAQYVTTTVLSLGPSQYTAYCSVRASQAGKAPEVGKNQIVAFAQPGSLFDPSLQCNNDETTAGGENAEDDDTFKARLRKFWLTARRGVLSAIEQGATSVSGVVSARAIEALTTIGDRPMPARLIQLYIADSSGVASAELATLVQQNLEDYRAGGIPVIVYQGQPLLVGLAFAIAFAAGANTASLRTAIQAAVFEFVNSHGVNDTLRVGDLFAVLTRFKSAGALVNQNSIVVPAGDLVPAVGQTIRTLLNLIAVN